MNDLINKKEAVTLLQKRSQQLVGIYGDLGGAMSGAARLIDELPIADRLQEWIPCSADLIRRSDAINLCEKWRNRTNEHHDKNGWYIADTLLKAIKELPSADRPQGEWLWQLADNGWADHICSVCGYTKNTDIHVSLNWSYCPNCGADMRKGVDNE